LQPAPLSSLNHGDAARRNISQDTVESSYRHARGTEMANLATPRLMPQSVRSFAEDWPLLTAAEAVQ
jgi:hypothetical protein